MTNSTPHSASAIRVDGLTHLPGATYGTHSAALGGREWRRALTRRIAKAAKADAAKARKGGQQ